MAFILNKCIPEPDPTPTFTVREWLPRLWVVVTELKEPYELFVFAGPNDSYKPGLFVTRQEADARCDALSKMTWEELRKADFLFDQYCIVDNPPCCCIEI